MYQYRSPQAIDTDPFSSFSNSYNSSHSSTLLSSPSSPFASPTLSRMTSPSGAGTGVAQRSSTWQDKLEGPHSPAQTAPYISSMIYPQMSKVPIARNLVLPSLPNTSLQFPALGFSSHPVEPIPNNLLEHCQNRRIPLPSYNVLSDRRGKRTAWSCTVSVGGQNIPARYWYDGQYVNTAKEDAAEAALKKLVGSVAQGPSCGSQGLSQQGRVLGWGR